MLLQDDSQVIPEKPRTKLKLRVLSSVFSWTVSGYVSCELTDNSNNNNSISSNYSTLVKSHW